MEKCVSHRFKEITLFQRFYLFLQKSLTGRYQFALDTKTHLSKLFDTERNMHSPSVFRKNKKSELELVK